MIYSRRCAYAIRALARLTMMRPDGYVLLDELLAGADLPRHFVAKIFQDLVRQGLLVSAKGRHGGFALARPPQRIRLRQIVAALDGLDQFHECIAGYKHCDGKHPCPHHQAWGPVRQRIRDFMDQTTLAQMARTVRFKLQAQGQPLPVLTSVPKPLPRHLSARRYQRQGATFPQTMGGGRINRPIKLVVVGQAPTPEDPVIGGETPQVQRLDVSTARAK